ncbi:MAG: hypothetical protein KAS93_06605 [Gammaproteobacteria bacterium]|nr:hypothetical protein [Gammaproteobacteria bacterium]
MSVELLKAATSTGTGDSVTSVHPEQEDKSFQVVVTGGPTQVTVDIEGSINGGVSYDQLLRHDVTADGNLFHMNGKPVTSIRANLITLTGGTSPTVTLKMGS